MKKILIGATGFVGMNLREQMDFDALISSKNIGEYKGESAELAIIAVGDARKWYANQNPEQDQLHIQKAIDDICAININRVIHFSTVDVYATRQGNELELTDQISSDPYGKNRYLLERALAERFKDVKTVRLPGLYGPGLKKNIIFDLLNARDLSNFNPNSAFQWFDLLELSNVLDFVQSTELATLNVCAEPLTVGELLSALGRDSGEVSTAAPMVCYDIRTIHAQSFGKSGSYLFTKGESIAGIQHFLNDRTPEAI